MKKSAFELFVERILDDDYSPEGISEWGELKPEHQKEIKIEVLDDKFECKNWQEYFFDCNESIEFLETANRSYVNLLLPPQFSEQEGLIYCGEFFGVSVSRAFDKILEDYCKWRVDKIILCYNFPTESEVYFSKHEDEIRDDLIEQARGDK